MNRPLSLAIALALPIALTACNSSSNKPVAQNSASQPASSTPTPTPTAAGGTDAQRVAAIQLTAADLPSGWKTQALTTTPAKQREEDAYFDACLGVPTIEDIQTTSSEKDFARPDGFAFAGGLINVTKTAAQAQQDQVALTGPKAVSCGVADAKKFLTPPKGARIVSITGSKLDVPSGQIGIRTVITLKLSNGRDVTLTTDDIGIIVNRFEVQLNFTGVVQPVQKTLEDAVTAKVFARAMANAA
jgi:hypothetical protein